MQEEMPITSNWNKSPTLFSGTFGPFCITSTSDHNIQTLPDGPHSRNYHLGSQEGEMDEHFL